MNADYHQILLIHGKILNPMKTTPVEEKLRSIDAVQRYAYAVVLEYAGQDEPIRWRILVRQLALRAPGP